MNSDDCDNSLGAKNNNASLQNDKLMHTASESYCNVYISKRAIVDISCIDMLVKNMWIKYLNIDFRRTWTRTRVYVCIRIHTYTPVQALTYSILQSQYFLYWFFWIEIVSACLVCASALIRKRAPRCSKATGFKP